SVDRPPRVRSIPERSRDLELAKDGRERLRHQRVTESRRQSVKEATCPPVVCSLPKLHGRCRLTGFEPRPYLQPLVPLTHGFRGDSVVRPFFAPDSAGAAARSSAAVTAGGGLGSAGGVGGTS